MGAVLIVCFGVSALAAIAAIAGTFVALFLTRVERTARFAVGTSVVAVIPGVLFVAHATVYALVKPGAATEPYHLWTILPAAVWILVGPFVLLRSYGLARPGRVPVYLDVLRFCLAMGWMASSFVTVFFASLV
jgi:hypothetical protein